VAGLGVEQVLLLVLVLLVLMAVLVAEEKTGVERLLAQELLVKEIMAAHSLVALITAEAVAVLELRALFAMVVLGHLAQLMGQQQLVLVVVEQDFTVQTLVVEAEAQVEAVMVALEHTIKVEEL
jgi:hypothetical protein